jgi:calnexin
VKKTIEKEAEGSTDEEDEEPSTMLDKIRLRVYEFLRESAASFDRVQS